MTAILKMLEIVLQKSRWNHDLFGPMTDWRKRRVHERP